MSTNVKQLPAVAKLNIDRHISELESLTDLMVRIKEKYEIADNMQHNADIWDMKSSPFSNRAQFQDNADRYGTEADALQIKYYKKLCKLNSTTYDELMMVAKGEDDKCIKERDTQHFPDKEDFLPEIFMTETEKANRKK